MNAFLPVGKLFPAGRGVQSTALSILKDSPRLGIGAVPHGFRSSFRDWASERTDHSREVIEAALAHVLRKQTEAAYGAVGSVRAAPSADERVDVLPERAAPFGFGAVDRGQSTSRISTPHASTSGGAERARNARSDLWRRKPE